METVPIISALRSCLQTISIATTTHGSDPSTSTECINNGHEGEASRSYSKDRQYILEWLTNYSTRIADRHNIKAMIGYLPTSIPSSSGFNAYNKDFPNDGLCADNLGSDEWAKRREK